MFHCTFIDVLIELHSIFSDCRMVLEMKISPEAVTKVERFLVTPREDDIKPSQKYFITLLFIQFDKQLS